MKHYSEYAIYDVDSLGEPHLVDYFVTYKDALKKFNELDKAYEDASCLTLVKETIMKRNY